MRSIKSKLIMQYSLLVLLIVVALSFISITYATKALEEDNNAAMLTFSVEIGKSIENEFQATLGELEFLSSHPTLREDVISDEALLELFQTEVDIREVEGLGLFDLEGQGRIYDKNHELSLIHIYIEMAL